MPELPEVETVRRDLSARLLSKKIRSVEVRCDKTVGGTTIPFQTALKGRSFSNIGRRGKLLYLTLSGKSEEYLLVHLKMTGQLVYVDGEEVSVGGHSLSSGSFSKAVGGDLPNRHTRVIITFSDKSVLYFNDLRKFGFMKIVDGGELDRILAAGYGPEPLDKDFSASYLYNKLKKRSIAIKTALLDQKMVSGLGNIYVDEVLFASGIRPQRPANKVTEHEAGLIASNSRRILKSAIAKRGTTFSNYVDGQGRTGNYSKLLKVYGRGQQACYQCGRPLTKTKVNGRGTHYCQNCQK